MIVQLNGIRDTTSQKGLCEECNNNVTAVYLNKKVADTSLRIASPQEYQEILPDCECCISPEQANLIHAALEQRQNGPNFKEMLYR
jgi:hypothetical protein